MDTQITNLLKSEGEKNLGVFVDITLKFEHHIASIAKKGNQMSGLLGEPSNTEMKKCFWLCLKQWSDTNLNTPHKYGVTLYMEACRGTGKITKMSD